MRVFALLLLGSLALPGVSAQALDPQLQSSAVGPDDLLMPETGVADYQVTVTISCPLRQDPLSAPWRLTWQNVRSEPYATVILNPVSDKVDFDETRCADAAYRERRTMTAIIMTNRDAPAFETFRTELKATLDQGTASYSTSVNLSTTNAFFPLTQVLPDELFQRAKPGESFAFVVDLNNLGNGPSRVVATAQPVGKNHVNHTAAPVDQVVAHKASATVVLSGTTPDGSGAVNYIASTTARFLTSSPDPRGELTDETSITFSLHVANFAQSPGAPLPGVLLVVAAALAGMARRRAA